VAANVAGVFEGYVEFPGSGSHQFKYSKAPDKGAPAYGDGGSGRLVTNAQARPFQYRRAVTTP